MPSKKTRPNYMERLPAWFVPGPQHVICAKGKMAREHPANCLLRSLVQTHLKEYSECPTKLDRSFVVSKILKIIRNGGDGGFVRENGGTWFDIGDRNAREKIGQAMRDKLHTQFKSSTKAKASKRRSCMEYGATMSVPVKELSFPVLNVPLGHKATSSSFTRIGPKPVEADMEPLPLSEGVPILDLSRSSIVSADSESSFHLAMDEMYQAHFSDSSEDGFALY